MPKNILEAVFCSSNDEKQFLPIKFYHNCSMSGTRKSVVFFCDVPELVETVLESSQ